MVLLESAEVAGFFLVPQPRLPGIRPYRDTLQINTRDVLHYREIHWRYLPHWPERVQFYIMHRCNLDSLVAYLEFRVTSLATMIPDFVNGTSYCIDLLLLCIEKKNRIPLLCTSLSILDEPEMKFWLRDPDWAMRRDALAIYGSVHTIVP